jgi:isoquinoline 1-oxidoreductase subunit beta
MGSGGGLNRRSFLIAASATAGGLALGFAVPLDPRRSASSAQAADAPEINCWLTIARDDTVTIRVAHSEMGQGALTGLAMLVAEELECDWSKVRTEFVSPTENTRRDNAWGDTSTGASRSIASSQLYLRQAGATARDMLITAAATRWRVRAEQCTARNSVITHQPSGRTLNYGAVAEEAAKVEPSTDIKLKAPQDWRLAGTPQKRLDVRDKVTGAPIYAIDVRLPGMLYAAIVHCPVFRGTPKSIDEGSIAGMRGVRRIVRMDDAVAVIADSWWRAKRAADVLKVTWDDRGNGALSTASIAELVREGLGTQSAQVGHKRGDTATALGGAVKQLTADYEVPFLAHATMEPQNCTAHVKPGSVEIWAPTQDPATAVATAALAANLPHDSITVHRMMLGGGFGRRAPIQEYVRQSVLIAKEVEAPVKLVWTREEDIKHDLYRPFSMARLAAGLDAEGMPCALTIRLAGPSFVASLVPAFIPSVVDWTYISGLGDEMGYDVPNYLVDYAIRATAVPLGVWRAINYTQNAFYKESFIDEMAHEAGIDPYLYRRKLLAKSPRDLAVLDAAAAKADWNSPPQRGVYRGIALSRACGSYCAQVAEISFDHGRLRVRRVVSAIDPGYAVNPLSIEMQTQGAVVYALTAALYGEITVAEGGVEQSNFDTYEMLRLADVPHVETVVVPSGGFWGGVGEPPVPPLAPALCNAIFAATGKRVRTLPLRKHDFLSI